MEKIKVCFIIFLEILLHVMSCILVFKLFSDIRLTRLYIRQKFNSFSTQENAGQLEAFEAVPVFGLHIYSNLKHFICLLKKT